MAGENHKPALCDKLAHHVLQNLGVHRIQPAERLIQYNDLRVIYQSGRQLHFLLISLGKGFQLLVLVL